jgi:hypothetical protein
VARISLRRQSCLFFWWLDLIRDICAHHEVKIMRDVNKDRVHLFVSIAPQVTFPPVATIAQREDGSPSDGGVYAHQEAVLGAAPVGASISVAVRGM